MTTKQLYHVLTIVSAALLLTTPVVLAAPAADVDAEAGVADPGQCDDDDFDVACCDEELCGTFCLVKIGDTCIEISDVTSVQANIEFVAAHHDPVAAQVDTSAIPPGQCDDDDFDVACCEDWHCTTLCLVKIGGTCIEASDLTLQ